MTATTERQIRRVLRHDSQHAMRSLRGESGDVLAFALGIERGRTRPRKRLLRFLGTAIESTQPCQK